VVAMGRSTFETGCWAGREARPSAPQELSWPFRFIPN
jgi:hypothetical protein